MPPRPAFGNAIEFTTDQDLLALSVDLDAMRTQSLLVCERVLGPYHKDTLFRLMYRWVNIYISSHGCLIFVKITRFMFSVNVLIRGAAYADDLRYQKCIDLWRRALEIRVEKDSVSIVCYNYCLWSSYITSIYNK